MLKLLINYLDNNYHLLLEINRLILNKTNFTSRFAFLKSHDQKNSTCKCQNGGRGRV